MDTMTDTRVGALHWRRYVAQFCALSGAIVFGIASLNYLVDPYLTHQWDTASVRRLRPPQEKLSAWGKTYALARLRPSVVYLGNSRTELGMPTTAAQFAGKSVFNGALSGASLSDMIAMSQHAANAGRLDTVVWGVDAASFSMMLGVTDFDRELVTDGAGYFARRALLDLKRALTLDMTQDSLSLLRGQFGAVCHSSLARRGQRDELCMRVRIAERGGTRAAIAPRIVEFMRGDGPTEQANTAFDGALGTLCGAGPMIRLYINPTHALMQDALYWRAKWTPMEQWQRTLTDTVARHRGRGCDVRLYDFSGYNSITTEAIPQVSGQADMRYFWEPSHYRVNVGDMIMQRMFGGASSVPTDFGLELTPTMVLDHQRAVRAAQERYHAEHATETALVRALATGASINAH